MRASTLLPALRPHGLLALRGGGAPHQVLDTFSGMVMAQGGYSWFWWVAMAGYTTGVSLLVRQQANPSMGWVMGLVMATLTAYGGGVLPAILLGEPSVIVSTEWAVPAIALAWTLTTVPSIENALRSQLSRFALSTGFEFIRYYVVLGGASRAHATLRPPPHYPVSTLGPLVCGTLGGCGGAILPATIFAPPYWGVPLSAGLNWSFKVAFIYSLWLQLTTRDPNAAPIVAALGLSNPLHAQAIGCFFLAVVMPVLSVCFGIEPLGPCLAKIIAPPKPVEPLAPSAGMRLDEPAPDSPPEDDAGAHAPAHQKVTPRSARRRTIR